MLTKTKYKSQKQRVQHAFDLLKQITDIQINHLQKKIALRDNYIKELEAKYVDNPTQ